ncbi:MAG: B12-binding domain-containing protein, partial [Thermovirgaceae bacterium]|nr:B12-binding domain-containing protein [Thermovirgaceae bacterium]
MKEGAVEFREALLSMDRVKASAILNEAATPGDMSGVESIILDALEDIGTAWEQGDLSLSQVYMAGVISEELVTPLLSHEKLDPGEKPLTAIAVLEDHHALGKRIVLSLMRAEGLAVMDYGQGVTAEAIAERASNDGIETLCISTLMLHSALRVKTLREELAKRNSYP